MTPRTCTRTLLSLGSFSTCCRSLVPRRALPLVVCTAYIALGERASLPAVPAEEAVMARRCCPFGVRFRFCGIVCTRRRLVCTVCRAPLPVLSGTYYKKTLILFAVGTLLLVATSLASSSQVSKVTRGVCVAAPVPCHCCCCCCCCRCVRHRQQAWSLCQLCGFHHSTQFPRLYMPRVQILELNDNFLTIKTTFDKVNDDTLITHRLSSVHTLLRTWPSVGYSLI